MQQKNLTHVNILIQVLDLKVLFSFKKNPFITSHHSHEGSKSFTMVTQV